PSELSDADAAVLPGVGAFDDCMQALQKQALLEGTRQFIRSGKPFLGICVGYQALFQRSEEFNSRQSGLGIFPGSVVRFAERPGFKIPQIGWNQLNKFGQTARCSKTCRRGRTLISCIAFSPNPRMPRWRPVAQPTERVLLRPFGGITSLRPNFTPRKVSGSDCNC